MKYNLDLSVGMCSNNKPFILTNIEPRLTQAATGGVLLKKLFLNVSKYSQENTCVRVSF